MGIRKISPLESVLIGRKGSLTSIKIIDELLVIPLNANQISKKIKKNYNTVRHHTEILMEHNIIEKDKRNYGSLYMPTPYLRDHEKTYYKIKLLVESNSNSDEGKKNELNNKGT